MHSLELKVPPLVVLAFIATLMWFASQAAPAAGLQVPARHAIGLGLATVGVGTAVAGVVSFRIAKTSVNPLNPAAASALVTSGVYQLSRNPMYLGALILLIGWAAFLANALGSILVPSFVLYMNRFQIGPEEKALTSLFTPGFTAYCVKVRRWL